MKIKVCKFGGTSMADAVAMNNCKDVIHADGERRYVVVSAPGKRAKTDVKVTDLLYNCYEQIVHKGTCADEFEKVRVRFMTIADDLKLNLDMKAVLDETQGEMDRIKSKDFCASRGEYLAARVFASLIGYDFVDAKDVVFFEENGLLNEGKSYYMVSEMAKKHERAVISGFYGTDADGNIKTFSRGGSDISGAVIARGVNAALYENWTDVSGFMACDPRIVPSAKVIKTISYKELRELSYMGASVLHPDSVFPVSKGLIPIRIKNTFAPEEEGTTIVPYMMYENEGNIVTGIAGKKDFTVILLEKSHMNSEVGFARKILTVLEAHGICFEHIPSGIDTLSLVLSNSELDGQLDAVLQEIQETVHPDNMYVHKDICLVATVGHGMMANIGTSARLFKALSDSRINIRLIDQGSSELNIIVGVAECDFERCISAIYHEFF